MSQIPMGSLLKVLKNLECSKTDPTRCRFLDCTLYSVHIVQGVQCVHFLFPKQVQGVTGISELKLFRLQKVFLRITMPIKGAGGGGGSIKHSALKCYFNLQR